MPSPRRRSLARRSPVLLYRVEPFAEEQVVRLRAWFTNDYGRMDGEMIAEATITEPDGAYPKGQWFTSQDTDAIHGLPEDIRDGVFQFDDALREHLRRSQ